MTRTPVRERSLPDYTRGEEIANMISHIIGAVMGVFVLTSAIITAARHHNVWGIVSSSIYGAFLISLFTISSVYHGMLPCYGKKIMRVIDHCSIYFLIAGTYTPILLSAMRPVHPAWAWTVFGAQWALAIFATVFTAIDHEKFSKLSMASYIGMGWFVVIALNPTLDVLHGEGFMWLLGGGIAYTVGAVLYGLGKSKPILHTVFHIFVDIGAMMHAVCIINYVL